MKVNFHLTTSSPSFEEACKELNIPLYVLPPYNPKYNGRIERSNRIIREYVVFPMNEVSGWKQVFIIKIKV